MKLNVKLLEKVKKHIKKEPRRLNMSEWNQVAVPGRYINTDAEKGFFSRLKLTKRTAPPCGTVGCIAGWATMLSGVSEIPIDDAAIELLGINEEAAQELFFMGSWPRPFRILYRAAKSSRERASITCKRIDAFIEQYRDK